jgi:hypothetical protein
VHMLLFIVDALQPKSFRHPRKGARLDGDRM